MAVEQAAFVTCNSFRLLEVFNRHFKLKKEEACKKVDTGEKGGRRVREKETEVSRGKTHTQKIKEIRLLASSQTCAFPSKSVSVVAESIIGCQKHANQGTRRVKLLSDGLRSDTVMYANWKDKQGHRSHQDLVQ